MALDFAALLRSRIDSGDSLDSALAVIHQEGHHVY